MSPGAWPRLTFCIPFYRDLEHLEVALRSVLAQTHTDWRCLVVDDAGPQPQAQALVASLHDPRIGYVRNAENLGLAGNWNRCLALADTPLVTLLHADDALLPDYGREILALADRFPEACAYFCRARIIDAGGRPAFSLADRFKDLLMPSRDEIVPLQGQDGLRLLMRGNFVFCPSLCYRRERLPLPAFDPAWRMVLDLEWLTRTLLEGSQLFGSPAVAYAYRRHGESQTAILTRSQLRFHEEIALHRRVAALCLARGWTAAAASARSMMSVRLHLLYQVATRLLRLDLPRAVSFMAVLGSSFGRRDGSTSLPSA